MRSCRDRPGSRNGSPIRFARWLPNPRDPPSPAVSAPVMTAKGAPELSYKLPDSFHPPATRESSPCPRSNGRSQTPLTLRTLRRSNEDRLRSPFRYSLGLLTVEPSALSFEP